MARRGAQGKKIKAQSEELATLEKRLHAKLESNALFYKEFTEGKWDQLRTRMVQSEDRFREMNERFDRLKGYFEGLVSMVIAQNTRIDKVLLRLEDRNRGINIFESRN